MSRSAVAPYKLLTVTESCPIRITTEQHMLSTNDTLKLMTVLNKIELVVKGNFCLSGGCCCKT